MILARKIRMKPNEFQLQQLWQSVGTARWVYNWALTRQEENYQQGGKFLLDGFLRKEITLMKQTEEFAWLKQVSNNVAKQAVKDLCIAYKKFFDRLADKPRFKNRRHSKPSFYHDTDKIKFKHDSVKIEKIGWISLAEHGRIPNDAKVSNPRISFDGKYWYLSVGIEEPEQTIELTESLGIDVGIKDLAVCSNGMIFKNINKTHTVRKAEKHLRRLQRKVSRKYEMNKEGSRFVKTCNIQKLEKRIRILHRRLTGIRDNHIHQTTTSIVKTKPSRIVMETLNIKGMMKNRHLSKAIANQKLAEFIRQIAYKCAKYGIEFIQADKWFPSSKTCSSCGCKKAKLSLSERVFHCDYCGESVDRDLNASINLSCYEFAHVT
ncbi:putative transposase [Croceifilum oryzae]|uniref:Transposase n=1 Tax=Croceifilum oryzae TaxID=1553429 RepID=A0AAJ1TMT9_9BACL|nr:transposase [Croceifilum oryzae]MDQ0418746.1 putative transposase [Croceifilum oryzae]